MKTLNSESLALLKIRNIFRQFSSAPFLPLLAKLVKNSATDSSGQLLFPSAPFELFSRNFDHLATLESGRFTRATQRSSG
jgi:hypothetical protein